MTSARKRIWGWYFFDWASQPYSTLVLTFVFAPYFAEVARAHFASVGHAPSVAAAEAQALWGWGQTISGIVIACLAPFLGAVADGSGRRIAWIWLFSVFYVAGSFMLWTLMPDASAPATVLIWFAIGLIGMEFATIFTNALMPDLTGPENMGKVSGTGFAFGYAGGILSLILMLVFFVENSTGKTLVGLAPAFGLDPALREGTRAVGPFTAIWYIVFMIPFFLWVREPNHRAPRVPVAQSLRRLAGFISSLPKRPSLFAFLGASMFYRDALNALYAFGGVYASGVLGWSVKQIGVFGIVGALTAALATWAGGHIDSSRGPKPVIVASAWVLIVVCLVIIGMDRTSIFGIPFAEGSSTPDILFYICGALIGAAGGTIQAASRTMMVFHTTADRSAEAFGLYALSGKATAFIAPFAIAIASSASGSQRIGISPLILLFLIGLVLLIWVQPKGDQAGK
ncbi:MFS transporter [Neotabrizicola shimadae]|uniref:MFS transporter n=1 Tax=Neotabrizicola shimadae TaxID=2807096 RepID=A0A8G1EC89_9RHOB|nr:MFS transporter [Neotabrizicola shimadae]QYZ68936.1 MFS transporter [Neotabrizicola shimadae]